MREDDEIGHCVGLLRRIVIPFAVIIAVPVILWTITAVIWIFHNPLATASINAPERATLAVPTQQQSTLRQTKLADPQATERATPERLSLVEHPPDAPPSAPSAAQTADTSSALAAISNSATPVVAKAARGLLPPLATNDSATADTTGAMQLAVATEPEADVLSASVPLSEPIPLPRPRPHDAGTVRTADAMLSRVPRPRPQPAASGSGAQQETATNNPSVSPQQR